MVRHSSAKCTMAQYFSQPFPKPGRNVFNQLCTPSMYDPCVLPNDPGDDPKSKRDRDINISQIPPHQEIIKKRRERKEREGERKREREREEGQWNDELGSTRHDHIWSLFERNEKCSVKYVSPVLLLCSRFDSQLRVYVWYSGLLVTYEKWQDKACWHIFIMSLGARVCQNYSL